MLHRNPTHRPSNVGAFEPRKPVVLKASRISTPSGMVAKASVLVNP